VDAELLDGWVADSAVSFVVGTPRDEDLVLIDTTERALDAACRCGTLMASASRSVAL